ncbi:MAG: antibiotic biosynthesis monooxygenase [Nitrospira sp.]|nr:antibiotic biosynthesis monooxygenase [Nitrospira sp.]
MVLLLITIDAQPTKSRELEQTLCLLAGQVREEPGCLRSRIYRDVEQDHTLCLIESWASQADVDAHMQTEHWRILRGATELLGLSAQIQWCHISRTCGEEASEAADED